jgi:transcriptional regulator with XRE-family HTH domain
MGLDLKNMTFKEAAYLAKAESGMTAEDIAEATGESPGNVAQWFREHNYKHHPAPHKIPRLCKVLGNNLLLEWQQAQLQDFKSDQSHKIKTGSDLLSRTNDLARELGDVHQTVHEAMEDGEVDPQEASELSGELRDVEIEARRLREQLQPYAEQRAGHVIRGGQQRKIKLAGNE